MPSRIPEARRFVGTRTPEESERPQLELLQLELLQLELLQLELLQLELLQLEENFPRVKREKLGIFVKTPNFPNFFNRLHVETNGRAESSGRSFRLTKLPQVADFGA